MEHHAAYGKDVESLDIVVVDDSKTVLTMIRSMITSLKVKRVRCYDHAETALHSVLNEPPSVILTDLMMNPMSGYQLLRLVRQKTMEPLCFVPVMVITAHATQKWVSQLFEAGAHHVLAKPISSSILQNRLVSLTSDDRMMRLDGDRYVIDGMHEMLEEKHSRMRSLDKARLFHERILPHAREEQKQVDEIFTPPPEPKNKDVYVKPVMPRSMQIASQIRTQKQESGERETSSVDRPQRTRGYAQVSGRRRR